MSTKTIEISPRIADFVQYMSIVDPLSVNRLAYEYGYNPPSNPNERKGLLFEIIETYGDAGFRKIVQSHPDRELFLASLDERDEDELYQMPKYNRWRPIIANPAFADGSQVVKTTSDGQIVINRFSDLNNTNKTIILVGVGILLYLILSK